jgi:hypothetical protein
MDQQTEQTQEDWVKFCAQEPIQDVSPADVALMPT